MRPVRPSSSLKSSGRSALSALCVVVGLLFSSLAFGQGSIVSGHPVVTNGVGQPIPGASVAVCSSNPGVTPTSVCPNLATTFTDITDSTSCSGTNKPLNNQSNPTQGGSCSNPGFTDGHGNVVVFAAAATYWCEYYGRGIIGIYVVPCIFPGVGGGSGGGGTNVSVNGSLQSSVNLNGTTPVADSGFALAIPKTDGNNTSFEFPNFDPSEFCRTGSGIGSTFFIGYQGSTNPCLNPWAEVLQQPNGGAGIFGPTTFFGLISAGDALDLTNGPIYDEVLNCSSNPPVTNKLAKFNGSCAVITTTFDTANIIGITGNSGGASSGAQIAIGGHIPCVFDGATTAGDWVVNSTSAPGDCHDSGSSAAPTSSQGLGYAGSSNAGAGIYIVYVSAAGGTGGGGGGSGTVNPAAQFSLPYYAGAGSNTIISGNTPPSVNGQYYSMYTINAGTPVAPAAVQVGLSSRAVTGTTSTDSILYTDNASHVDYQGSVAVAVNVPTATTLGNSQFVTVLNNNTTGSTTALTLSSFWTFNGSVGLTIAQGQSCKLKVDAAGGKWDADCSEPQIAAGSNITLTRTPFGVSIASSAGGGSSVWSALTNPTGNLTLNHSTFTTEFDWTTPGSATGAILFKGNDSTGADTSSILAADTVSGSHQNPLSIGITGVKQLQSCWAPGPNGFILIGSVLSCTGVNLSPFPKTFFSSAVATHMLAEFWQSNSAYTGDFMRFNTATATGSCNFNLFTLYNGVTSTDGSNGGGSLATSLHCNGLFTGSASLSGLTLSGITGSTQCIHVNSSGVASGTGADCGAGGGSGTINPALQFAIPYYSAAGSSQTLSGLVAPTGPNGVPEVAVSIPSGGAATAPVMLLPGLAGRAITGTTSTDTILATDCNPKRVEYVGSVAVAITLPTATTLAVTNCTFRVTNNTSGSTTALTVTPTTWTINGAATLVIAQGQIATVFVDPNSSTNWVADVHEQALTAGANITFTRSALGLGIAALPGTVTSIATGAGLTGGTITGAGTISVPNGGITNVMLANPATTVNSQTCTLGSTCTIPIQTNGSGNTSQAGVNLSTSTTNSVGLTVTPVNSATNVEKFEITGGAYTGTASNLSGTPALPNGTTATTQTAKDNSTKIATTAYVDAPVPLTTGTSVTLSAPRQFFICTTTCTITVPVPAAGYEFCVRNNNNVATVITFAAIGSSARYENTAFTAYGTAGTGTLVSGGAAGDKMCLLGLDSTHYLVASFNGTWTAN